jgi:hypothetical protein
MRNERKKENLPAPARSTNDERTDASPENTAFRPKNSPPQPTRPSANRRGNYTEEIRTKTTPTFNLHGNPRTPDAVKNRKQKTKGGKIKGGEDERTVITRILHHHPRGEVEHHAEGFIGRMRQRAFE